MNNPIRLAMACAFVAALVPCVAKAQTLAQRNALNRIGSTQRRGAAANDTGTLEAASSLLSAPASLAYDATGNLYVADLNDHMIVEITPLGAISHVAGTGEQGFSGDGGGATSAMLDSPAGVAVDAAGNIYIADTHNQRIRKVVSGIITTIAGTGVAGFSGDGGAATSATLSLPTAITLDAAGNVYFADTSNHRIRKISGTTISTVAGDGDQAYLGDGASATQTGLDSPDGIAVDAAGNLYIGDTHNQRVRMVSASSGLISTLAGNGAKSFGGDGSAGASASIARPRGVTVSSNGNLYLADSDNNRIRSINLATGTISTVAGTGDQGFSGDTGPATSAVFNTPRAVAANAAGTVVAVSDTDNQRVREIAALNSETLGGVGNPGTEALLLSAQSPITIGTGTLTAALLNGGGATNGTVTLFDVTNGVVPFGTGTAVNGVATFSLAAATAGTHLFAARYQASGVAVVTSGVIGVVVNSISNDFSITATPTTETATRGSSASYTVTVTSIGAMFGSGITFAVSGLPTGSTATFSPTSIAAGGGPSTATTLVITSAKLVASSSRSPLTPITAIVLCAMWFPICFNRRLRARVYKSAKSAQLLTLCLLMIAAAALSGCGSGIRSPNPVPYPITITATSAASGTSPAVSHTVSVTLVLE